MNTNNTRHRTARVAVPVGAAVAVAVFGAGFALANGGSPASAQPPAAEPGALEPRADHSAPTAISQGDTPTAVKSGREPREAGTVLRTADGSAIGTVRFKRKSSGTEVEAKVTLPSGLTAMDAFHGFHVHANNKPENGDGCQADPAQPPATWFVSADGHFSEAGQAHSHHTGDMPSLLVNGDGTAVIEFTTARTSIAGLVGRAVVLHAQPDNFGNAPTGVGPDQYTANSPAATDKTAATGNAGDRIACGVLAVVR